MLQYLSLLAVELQRAIVSPPVTDCRGLMSIASVSGPMLQEQEASSHGTVCRGYVNI